MSRILLFLPLMLAACAQLPFGNRSAETAPEPAPVAPAPASSASPAAVLQGPSTSAAALDTVSEAEKDEARAAAAAAPAGGELGQVTVALGDPTDGGLWVKSDLVSAEAPGTVRTGDGEAIAVTLRPLGSDGGPQISLSALQALGLPLAGLHPVTLARAG
ncbi:hypothetical protein MWU52_06210 [Jannaschia sp. S6380]|uniref:hypothetical protein n=1 Tax=Jannaschia sp. S6380 TaxID=2926408 RepID=UPI001FF41467|nr:hypothetical protein [Jannaschia sp. S6380]MCK0167137.1 hypothetical protein [Jannaschia sp. S6380]